MVPAWPEKPIIIFLPFIHRDRDHLQEAIILGPARVYATSPAKGRLFDELRETWLMGLPRLLDSE